MARLGCPHPKQEKRCCCQVGCAPHFLSGFPRDAPRKESDCHRGQQGDRKRDGLSSGEDGSPCDGDSEVRRNSKEGEDSVPTVPCALTCPDVFLYMLTFTCQHTEAGPPKVRCIHTHINTCTCTHTYRLKHPQNTHFSIHSHARIH